MSEKQPNILLIITDHHAFHGHVNREDFDYTWPVFDRFCDEGIRFDRAYSVSPMCSPARASMMTGVYPSTHGMRRNNEGSSQTNITDLRSGQLLYSHYLSQAGYRNAYIGKWHCGAERIPVDYGIEGWSLPGYGKIYMSDAYKEYADERGLGEARAKIDRCLQYPEWRGQTLVLHDPSPWKFMTASGILEGPPEAHEEFFVAHLAEEKLRELSREDQPFSLVASFWGPHQPYFPTETYASMIKPRDIPEYPSFNDDLKGRGFRHVVHRYVAHTDCREIWPDWSIWQEVLALAYGQALQTDAAVGKVLETLDDTGLADNTIVVWCADHGDALACHGGTFDKSSTYTEEVGRVPMAIRWPKRFKGGEVCGELVSNMDVTATMLNAAGVNVPDHFDSRSMLPLCGKGIEHDRPNHLVCEHHGRIDKIPQRVIYKGRYKYVAALYDMDEMYDLEVDPYEMKNLLNDPGVSDVRREMRGLLIEHLEKSDATDGEVRRLLLMLRTVEP
ncbi:sulfatase-like hydrolase/transferase [Candidatus Hydrogenedentota bacterium]